VNAIKDSLAMVSTAQVSKTLADETESHGRMDSHMSL